MRRWLTSPKLWLFLLTVVPRLLYLATIPQTAILESVDARGYDLLARNLVGGHGFSMRDAPPFAPDGLRVPLYPLFVAGLYELAGQNPVVVAVSQTLLEGITALLVGGIGARLLGRRAGLAATVLYALTPVQWRYSAALLPEIPLAFLVALGVWLWVGQQTAEVLETSESQFTSPPRAGASLACGVVAGLAALCKPNLAGLALILALAAVWTVRKHRRSAIATAGAILLGAGLLISPWVFRNWLVFGRPFLSNASLGFVARVSAPATIGDVEDRRVAPWTPAWEARYHAIAAQAAERIGWNLAQGEPSDPWVADRQEREMARVAWEILRAHPAAALRAHLVGFARSWAPQEQTFWYRQLSRRPWEGTGLAPNAYRDAVEILLDGRPAAAFDLAFVLPWAQLDPLGRVLWYVWGLGHLLAPILMAACLWCLRQRPALPLVVGALIAYATLAPGPIGYVRFRVPVVPLITVLEVGGLLALHSALRTLTGRLGISSATPVLRGTLSDGLPAKAGK
jgi:4-amino-4-deoxy-L-arabinose transferase-like glycosyltransferase